MKPRKMRFEPPMDAISFIRKQPIAHQRLQNLRIKNEISREELPVRHPFLDSRLPARVSQKELDALLRETEKAESLLNLQQRVKGLHIRPITIERVPMSDIETIRIFPDGFMQGGKEELDPYMRFCFFDEQPNGVKTAHHYGMIMPEGAKARGSHIVPLGMAATMAFLRHEGVEALRIPGLDYTRKRKGVKRAGMRHHLKPDELAKRLKATGIDEEEKRKMINAATGVYKDWDHLSETEIYSRLHKFPWFTRFFFSPHLIRRYYHEMPARFPNKRVRFEGHAISPDLSPEGYGFHEIPTSVAQPLIPFMKEVKGG